jgi:hypothetical protein
MASSALPCRNSSDVTLSRSRFWRTVLSSSGTESSPSALRSSAMVLPASIACACLSSPIATTEKPLGHALHGAVDHVGR